MAAVLTPCVSTGTPDPAALTRLARRLHAGGCDGLFVVGSTGEMPLLDGPARRSLVAAARAGAPGAVIYAGVSGMGEAQTIRYAHQAADAGADVAIIMPPFFLKLDQRELLAYLRGIADACPIPVGLYHHLRMPTPIEPATVASLAQHGNVVVMKDTSPDASRLQALTAAAPSLALMQGREPLLLRSLGDGASGCVTALAGVVPEWHRTLMDAWAAGDMLGAQRAQTQINNLAALFSLPEVSRSFAHFSYALRRTLRWRGWIDHVEGMIPGFVPEPGFDEAVDTILRRGRVPTSDAATTDAAAGLVAEGSPADRG